MTLSNQTPKLTKRIYSIAVFTERKIMISSTAMQTQQRIVALSELARNDDEAIGIGHKKANALFPMADGWGTRYVACEVVSDELLERAISPS